MWRIPVARLANRYLDAFVAEDLSFVIVTKNSSRWIGTVLDEYRRYQINPCVLLDDSTTDETERVLINKSIRYAKITPKQPRVEAMIGMIEEHFDSKWIFRVDDDELPSQALLHWLGRRLTRIHASAVGFPRLHIRLNRKGSCESAKHRSSNAGNPLDIQWRLFQPGEVDYIDEIHTAGFVSRGKILMAPKSAYLAHFSWIIHGEEERRRKMREYDAQAQNAGSEFKPMMVFEEFDPGEYAIRRLPTREFDQLARKLHAGTIAHHETSV